jgi:catechol 2,3-dioxygenase-like lactoylglutathione lyase family enzyme
MSVVPKQLVALAYVADVAASMRFYTRLGFEVGNTHADPHSGETVWAALERGSASLMLGKASGAVDAGQQAVLFYLYYDDIADTRVRLAADGLPVGEMAYPFYCPKGEFRLTDPDGYVLMLTHT